MAAQRIHLLHPDDNVATALSPLEPGTIVEAPDGRRVEVRSAIPFGHKLALVPIARGAPVVKYGEVIGLASADIAPGEHVHVHNVESQRGRGDLAAGGASEAPEHDSRPVTSPSPAEPAPGGEHTSVPRQNPRPIT